MPAAARTASTTPPAILEETLAEFVFLSWPKNEITLVLDNIFTKDGYPINPRVSSYLLRPKTCTKVTYFEYKI